MKSSSDKKSIPDNNEKKALLATAGFSCIFGFSFMASRTALMHTNADMLLTIRFTVSMLAMLILILTESSKSASAESLSANS
jgi:hypothetical protein